MENEEINSSKDIFQSIYDQLRNNQSITVNAGEMVKQIALNSDKSVELISEVIRGYLKALIYSEHDPNFDEQTSFFIFSHLDELDRIELTYSKNSIGKTSVAISLLPENPKKKLFS